MVGCYFRLGDVAFMDGVIEYKQLILTDEKSLTRLAAQPLAIHMATV